MQFLEPAVAEVAKHQPRRVERIVGQRPLDFGVDAAGHHEQVGQAVVVEIDDAGAPADVARLDAEPARMVTSSKLPLPSLR